VTQVESAWGRYPGYCIDLVPCEAVARAWFGDLLLAESAECLRVEETDHTDRLYFPEAAVHWDLFRPTDHHSICPFKGEADYWTLTASDPPEENVVWTYRRPFDEVGGLEGFVCFYHERVRVELETPWPDGAVTVNRFPVWGTSDDLVRLLDVEPSGPNRFVGAPYRDRTRNVVEGGQLMAQSVVAASKALPRQRVTSASMIFSKAASFDLPLDIDLDVLRGGKTFSTVEARITQDATLRSTGLLLLDSGAPDLIRHAPPMPDVAGPGQSVPYEMRVTGRDLRIVEGAYSPDPDRVGPPEIYAWIRFRHAPAEQYLHTALLTQATTHWTIAAAMRPHAGYGEADAHVTLSTGIMSLAITFHDDVDVSQWMLYANPAPYAGRGLAQGDGRVFTEDGRLAATYSVQGVLRRFDRDPSSLGLDARTAM
jgi:uncharacterized protein (DUF427 family)/acyl-CoA thioesterase